MWDLRFNDSMCQIQPCNIYVKDLQITYTTCDFRIWFLYLFMYQFNMQRKYSHFTKMLKNDKKPTSQGVRRTVHGAESGGTNTSHDLHDNWAALQTSIFPSTGIYSPLIGHSDEGVFWANQGECWDMEESTVLQSPLELFQGSPALRKLEPGVQHNVCRD